MGSDTKENGSTVDPQDNSSAKDKKPGHPLKHVIVWFLVGALICILAFGLVHLLGFRANTSFLSGTGSIKEEEITNGIIYIIMYAGFVILAPVLLIAAGLLKVFISVKCFGKKKTYHEKDME